MTLTGNIHGFIWNMESEQMQVKVGFSQGNRRRGNNAHFLSDRWTFRLGRFARRSWRVAWCLPTPGPVRSVQFPTCAQLSSALRCLVSPQRRPQSDKYLAQDFRPSPKPLLSLGQTIRTQTPHTRAHTQKGGHTQAQDTGSARQNARVAIVVAAAAATQIPAATWRHLAKLKAATWRWEILLWSVYLDLVKEPGSTQVMSLLWRFYTDEHQDWEWKDFLNAKGLFCAGALFSEKKFSETLKVLLFNLVVVCVKKYLLFKLS